MLFTSMVPQVFKMMEVDTYSVANTERKKETAKRLDFYHGEQLPRLTEQLETLFSDPSAMTLAHLNIVGKSIRQLAQVYREQPARTIEGSEQDKKIFSEMVEQCNLDVKLKQASRFCKLLKTVIVRPVWRNNRMDVDLCTGDFTDAVCGLTPTELLKVLLTSYGPSGQIQDVTYDLWDAYQWQRLDYNGNPIEQAPNPYGVLPFIPIFDYAPTGSDFWLPGGSDLISMQEAINLKLVDLLHLLTTQSFGVGWIKGGQGGSSLRADPGSLVELPAEGALGFESQKAEIRAVVNAIDKLMKWTVVTQGLSAASMSTDLTDRQSGTAKTVDRLELEEIRADDISLWRGYEKQLFSLLRLVWNTHNPTRKLSDSATLSIDFSDPKAAADPLQQSQAWDLQLSMGVISPVDIAMELNPDITTREEAILHLLKIQQETKTLSGNP